MTVCVAARSEGIIIGASDRMLTSGDVQFEPASGRKGFEISNSIMALTAGDAAFQADLIRDVMGWANARIAEDKTRWLAVRACAESYSWYRARAKFNKAERDILMSLGLDRTTWVSQQQTLDSALVDTIARDLYRYEVPNVATIIAGVDALGAHIYVVSDGDVASLDTVGFAAVGGGARHAENQFMSDGHSWNDPLPDTLVRTYWAKKQAEVSPGVGAGTDMFVIGPAPGSLAWLPQGVLDRLEQSWQQRVKGETRVRARALDTMRTWLEQSRSDSAAPAQESGQEPPPTEEPPPEGAADAAGGGPTPPPETRH